MSDFSKEELANIGPKRWSLSKTADCSLRLETYIFFQETDLFAAAKASLQDGLQEKSSKLLDEGKRAVIGHDYAGALQPLSQCCHLICTNFGEMDDQLAG